MAKELRNMLKDNSALTQRRLIIRNALNGPKGSLLMDFLMDEYVYSEPTSNTETNAIAREAERNLVLRLRRMSKE